MVARLERSGVSHKTLALTSALTVGKKEGLEYETKQAYRKVGAAHLLALSGTHLGIIYGFIYLIFVRWVRHNHWRWHALPIILLCLWGYALVAGMPVSLVRAALMLSVFTVISLMQYDTDHLHPLALSAIIILMIAPTDLFSVSFQLSFVAVFFILVLWGPLRDMFQGIPWTVKLFGTSCVASFGIMPLITYYFHHLPLLGPFLSVILIPLTTVIIYLTLAAMLLPVAPLGWMLNTIVSFQEKVLDFSGSIPYSILTDLYPSKTVVALMYGAMLIAIIRLRTTPNLLET
jgi:competence protein ComEC